ncbi:conserved protein, unknown function [Hepatocystis sp. ex Piliocolobus tephrosceles]|nr:conserved protein, unknown function [Hepatocystis sp. ex Piliocolobus tephrosceles]
MKKENEIENKDEGMSNIPFQAPGSIDNYSTPAAYELDRRAKIFSQQYFFDGNSWTSLKKPLIIKKTIFDDDRIFTLKPFDSKDIPLQIEQSLSGKYDIKLYQHADSIICIEGEQKVLIKLPITQSILTWNCSERFPLLTKDWRPTVFLLNLSNAFVRITPDKCLIISKDEQETNSFKINCVSFTEGFCCCHPINNLGLLYGTYDQHKTLNIMKLPKLPASNGKYNYFLHFFSWGTMIIPKTVEILKGKMCSFKKNTIALLIIPPKINIHIDLCSASPICTELTYNKDFLITARKPNITDLEVYLTIKDKLIIYEYSYDLRLNKEKAPVSNLNIPIKFKIDKDEQKKKKTNPSYECNWTFDESSEQKIVRGANVVSSGHLMSPDLACIFDAETGIYYSNEHGIRHCKNFKRLEA